MMNTLTPCINATMLSVLQHCSPILAYRSDAAQTALNKRFFCAKNSAPGNVGLSGTAEMLARASLVRQFHLVRLPMIGVILSRVLNLIRDAIMKNTSKGQFAQQNHQTKTVSLFDCFLHRRQIASNIPGTKAERIKRHNQSVIVKFSGFAGGVA